MWYFKKDEKKGQPEIAILQWNYILLFYVFYIYIEFVQIYCANFNMYNLIKLSFSLSNFD